MHIRRRLARSVGPFPTLRLHTTTQDSLGEGAVRVSSRLCNGLMWFFMVGYGQRWFNSPLNSLRLFLFSQDLFFFSQSSHLCCLALVSVSKSLCKVSSVSWPGLPYQIFLALFPSFTCSEVSTGSGSTGNNCAQT